MLHGGVEPRFAFSNTAIGKALVGVGEEKKVSDTDLSFSGFDLEKYFKCDSSFSAKLTDTEALTDVTQASREVYTGYQMILGEDAQLGHFMKVDYSCEV